MTKPQRQKVKDYLHSIMTMARDAERAVDSGDWDEAMDCLSDVETDTKRAMSMLEEEHAK